MADDVEVIWVKREREYFCKRGWTQNREPRPSGKSVGLASAPVGHTGNASLVWKRNDRMAIHSKSVSSYRSIHRLHAAELRLQRLGWSTPLPYSAAM